MTMADLEKRAREWLNSRWQMSFHDEVPSLTSLMESVRREGKAEGRAEAMEEAAKVADDHVIQKNTGQRNVIAEWIASAIRTLAAPKKEMGT